VTITCRTIAAALFAAPALLAAQASSPPPIAEQIAAAVQPLPAAMRDGAMVLGYKTGTKLEVIRAGNNGMRCLALYVVRPDFHVACYHDGLEPFMLRGRELREQGVAKVDSVRDADVAAGKVKMPSYGALYSLTGKKETWNPATSAITGAQPLAVIYMPFATTATTGLPSTMVRGTPWLMGAGTSKAHVMIIGTMGQ
jgi:hypothetical protein